MYTLLKSEGVKGIKVPVTPTHEGSREDPHEDGALLTRGHTRGRMGIARCSRPRERQHETQRSFELLLVPSFGVMLLFDGVHALVGFVEQVLPTPVQIAELLG